jgi:FkbM family methyltransferase
VRVGALSTAVREHNLPLPELIKIDIEGGEIEMLEGSREVLGKCRPILLIELHGTNEAVRPNPAGSRVLFLRAW